MFGLGRRLSGDAQVTAKLGHSRPVDLVSKAWRERFEIEEVGKVEPRISETGTISHILKQGQAPLESRHVVKGPLQRLLQHQIKCSHISKADRVWPKK